MSTPLERLELEDIGVGKRERENERESVCGKRRLERFVLRVSEEEKVEVEEKERSEEVVWERRWM